MKQGTEAGTWKPKPLQNRYEDLGLGLAFKGLLPQPITVSLRLPSLNLWNFFPLRISLKDFYLFRQKDEYESRRLLVDTMRSLKATNLAAWFVARSRGSL